MSKNDLFPGLEVQHHNMKKTDLDIQVDNCKYLNRLLITPKTTQKSYKPIGQSLTVSEHAKAGNLKTCSQVLNSLAIYSEKLKYITIYIQQKF